MTRHLDPSAELFCIYTWQVKTLRGHEKDITTAHVIGGGGVNWENPQPPLVVSLSQDSCVKAWDVSQVSHIASLAYIPIR